MKMRTPAKVSAARQLAAQLSMCVYSCKIGRPMPGTNSKSIDAFYNAHLNFDPEGRDAETIREVFDEANEALEDYKGPVLTLSEAMHLFYMWPEFKEKYGVKWQVDLSNAIGQFKREYQVARDSSGTSKPTALWTKFGAKQTGRGADSARKFKERQDFFESWMIKALRLRRLDPKRTFTVEERERLYFQQNGICAYHDQPRICGGERRMDFDDSEAHHIFPHSKGGETELRNAVLIHKSCNRKLGDRYVPVTSDIIMAIPTES